MPYVYPDNDLAYSGNFLSMMYKMTELKYEPDPRLERALDILFILHADHEQNCSTSAVRSVGSSQVDPYSAIAAGVAALYGPLHGGANEAVLRMLKRIETKENIPDFIKGVKEGNERLMGFGHRVYKNYDPRAKIIKKATEDVFEVTGKNPLLEIATELEKIALEDEYFIKRKLYPNVDFYSGLIYEAMGLPVAMFPVMFAIGRTSGWIAQWLEMVQDSEQKIARPRQIYTGGRERDYVPIDAALAPGRCGRQRVRLRDAVRHARRRRSRVPSLAWMFACATVRESSSGPSRPDDKALLVRGMASLSPRSARLRFLAPKNRLTLAELRYLTEVDHVDHYALVAVLADDPTTMAGVGRWVRDARAPRRRRGRRRRRRLPPGPGPRDARSASALADGARALGIARFTAVMLPENTAAQRLFAHISGRLTTRFDGGTYSLVADLAA